MKIKKHKQRWIGVVAVVLGLGFALTAGAAIPDVTQEGIETAVENEILFDPAVSLDDVAIEVDRGVVTLTGTVPSILDKERAAHLAQTVRGVRSVVNRLEVMPHRVVPDDALRQDVNEALLLDPATESYELGVAVRDGHVTLTGTVDSYQERMLAKKVVRDVRGVRAIKDRIEVDVATERPDPEIEAEVRQALRWDILVDDGLLDVDVRNGRVRLTGSVGSAAEKRRATADAWVTGVRQVDTKALEVADWAHDERQRATTRMVRSDEAIASAVETALLEDPRVASFEIEPTVDNGVVTLRGSVDHLNAKRAAAQDARNTAGVWRVKNRVRVTDDMRSDQAIASDVRTTLRLDPNVSRHEIDVSVDEGTVVLEGTVDTLFEKAEADEAASTIMGVRTVRNKLDVDDDLAPLVFDPYVEDWYAPDFAWYVYDVERTFKDDEAIRDDTHDELWWSPFVDADEVAIAVEDGVVHLTGVVDSWAEKRAATENAFEAGAVWVDNDLAVDTDRS